MRTITVSRYTLKTEVNLLIVFKVNGKDPQMTSNDLVLLYLLLTFTLVSILI